MLKEALRLFLGLTILTGFIYPLFVTLFAQVLWHTSANGTLITVKEHVVGSRYIGQQFNDKKYFWSRPSAVNYQPMPSGGSNLGPSNPLLRKQVVERAEKIVKEHPGSTFAAIPSDLLYASGSGVDPHISLQAALFQLDRVAQARGLSSEAKEKLKEKIYEVSKWEFNPSNMSRYVNVLYLNITLDEMK